MDGVTYGERAYIRKRNRTLGRRAVVRHNWPVTSGHSNLNLSLRPYPNVTQALSLPNFANTDYHCARLSSPRSPRYSVSLPNHVPDEPDRRSEYCSLDELLSGKCINYAHMSSSFPGPDSQIRTNTEILSDRMQFSVARHKRWKSPLFQICTKKDLFIALSSSGILLRQRCFRA